MTTQPPELDERIKGRVGYGLIQVITGNGKGKTTSAIGQAIRTAGAGKHAAIIYFDKGGAHYSERIVFDERLNGHVDYWAFGRDRIDPKTGRFDFSVNEEDREFARLGLAKAREVIGGCQYELVVLDEINSCVHLGMCTSQSVLDILGIKPPHIEIVLTGRNAPSEFIEAAHLVTEANLVKHYFYSGVPAREGLDF